MNLPPRKGENLFVRAKFALDTLQTFLASADAFITSAHAPNTKMDEESGDWMPLLHEEKMVSWWMDSDFYEN
jgi:hypothetical protein